MEIISRKEAKSRGLSLYYTGETCKHGHIDQRRVDSCACLTCLKLKREEYFPQYYEDNKEKLQQANRDRYRENSEYHHNYRKDNMDRYKEYRRAYAKENPDIFRAANHKRRALIKQAEGSFTKADIDRLKEIQNNLCNMCSIDLLTTGYHIDHIVPLSRCGNNWPENLQLLCPTCNLRKGTKLPEEL